MTPVQTPMRAGDYVAMLAIVALVWLAGSWLAWATTAGAPPQPHYCFRGDEIPCQLSVDPPTMCDRASCAKGR